MGQRLPAMWETRVQSLGQKISWRRKWQPTPVFVPGKSHGQRSLAGYSSWDCKELDTTEQLSTTTTSVYIYTHIHSFKRWVLMAAKSLASIAINRMTGHMILGNFLSAFCALAVSFVKWEYLQYLISHMEPHELIHEYT